MEDKQGKAYPLIFLTSKNFLAMTMKITMRILTTTQAMRNRRKSRICRVCSHLAKKMIKQPSNVKLDFQYQLKNVLTW